jgi:hypothetical protein
VSSNSKKSQCSIKAEKLCDFSILPSRKISKYFQKPLISSYLYEKIIKQEGVLEIESEDIPYIVKIISKYWSLKKSRSLGAPIIKSLEVEPWVGTKSLLDTAKDYNKVLKTTSDLKKLKCIFNLIFKREKLKRESLILLSETLQTLLYPMQTILSIFLSYLRYFHHSYQLF